MLQAGYARAGRSWALGENLAWGTGRLATAAAIMRSWMHSPGHRANILHRSFRDVGIGVVIGVPTPTDVPGATFTSDFGARG